MSPLYSVVHLLTVIVVGDMHGRMVMADEPRLLGKIPKYDRSCR